PMLKEQGLGWSIRKISSGLLYFNVEAGADRTNPAQPTIYQEYSADLDSLENISSLESVANYKNHCRVFGTNEQVDVYAPGVSSSVAGLDRQSMYLHFPDINGGGLSAAEEQSALRQLGRSELAKQDYRYYKLIDGDVPPDKIQNVYYSLGDLVVVKDTYGDKSTMRIVEQVITDDAQGTRYNPTFELVL
ncbi:MAG: Gp37-like protein, partial [bacterium]